MDILKYIKDGIETRKFLMKAALKHLEKNEVAAEDAISVVMSLVVIGVAGSIGVFIMDRVVTTTGTPSNSEVNNSSNSLLEAVSTGFDFTIILIIASIGAIAIGYMFTLFPRKGGGTQ